eukprot:6901050-Heterocapsa_arctica.AAC.1
MKSVSSCTAHASPEVFHDVRLAVMPVQLFPSCPGFLASPILMPVVPSCDNSSCGSTLQLMPRPPLLP